MSALNKKLTVTFKVAVNFLDLFQGQRKEDWL